eukprot:GDKI01046661.1.p1 GENE.GDKI01046661.1~~GDKI01046661.1.p1  ORF type:complete len:400 (-),score=90.18 GDKI01046661.1:122-1321(-)
MSSETPNIPKISIDDYILVKQIGKGAFATVWLAKHKKTKHICAIKKIAFSRITTDVTAQHLKNEREALEEMTLANGGAGVTGVGKLLGTGKDRRSLYLCLEFISGAPLFKHWRMSNGLTHMAVRHYTAQLIRILYSLHARDWCYRDLKGANVMLDGKGMIRLVDFGLAKKLPNNGRTMSVCGTAHAMAPEMLYIRQQILAEEDRKFALEMQQMHQGNKNSVSENTVSTGDGDGNKDAELTQLNSDALPPGIEFHPEGYTRAVDWWSLGVLVYEMYTCDAPFGYDDYLGGRERAIHELAYDSPESVVWPEDKSVPEEGKQMVADLMQVDETRRLGVNGLQEFISHPFFQGYDWSMIDDDAYIPPFDQTLGFFEKDAFESEEESDGDEANGGSKEDPFADF